MELGLALQGLGVLWCAHQTSGTVSTRIGLNCPGRASVASTGQTSFGLDSSEPDYCQAWRPFRSSRPVCTMSRCMIRKTLSIPAKVAERYDT